jgi:hypothetical protein
MNISSYLNDILTKTKGEDVVSAFISAVDILNADHLVDITPEKAIVTTGVIGKTIRKGIARILYALSQYTPPNKRIIILTQNEYDNLNGVNDDTLYIIRKEDKCFAVTLDGDGYLDPSKHSMHALDETWWDLFGWQIKTLVKYNDGFGSIALFVGKDFNVDEVYEDQFSGSKCDKLEKVRFDMPNYFISARAFKDCKDLKFVELGDGITSIATDAFSGCNDLTIIINKPAGSVLGAPWGAQNATIIWSA